MSNMHNPIDIAKELRFSLVDKPDPSVNYIYALERLIEAAELARSWASKAGITDSPIALALQDFPDQYEVEAQKLRAALPILHSMEGPVVVSECGEFRHSNSADADSIESAEIGYLKPDERLGEFEMVPCVGLYEFLAQTFHLIQQTGGHLRYKGKKVEAVGMEQTAGAGFGTPIDDESFVYYDGRLSTIGEIVK
jgi:hypothetical protein